MCTVVVIKRTAPAPLVVAANRDELYARRAAPPRRVLEDPRVVAGLDLAKGGTWMGANGAGLFAALTNQRQHGGVDAARASRGEVVLETLRQPDVARVDDLLRSLDGRAYNGFNLMYGDGAELRVAYARADRPEVEIHALGEGVWVLSNDRIGSAHFPKTRRARALIEPHAGASWPSLQSALHAALADHERPPIDQIPEPPAGSRFTREALRALQSICVHTPIYGTRSATVLALAPGRVERYLYADGPPCEAELEDMTGLFR